MKITATTWTIKELIEKQKTINPKPQYQRTSVWSPQKKRLLIDSILRGYDLPKFYVSDTSKGAHYKYEVTDGQQRMRAIWEFVNKNDTINYSLDETVIDGINTKGFKYSDLQKSTNKQLLNRFQNFELNIAIIKQATPEEVRSLFARLQMGERLNPAELRHAIASNIGCAIFALSETAPFFTGIFIIGMLLLLV